LNIRLTNEINPCDGSSYIRLHRADHAISRRRPEGNQLLLLEVTRFEDLPP